MIYNAGMSIIESIRNWFQGKTQWQNQPPKLPDSYFVGEEYVKDPTRIDVVINAQFISGGLVHPFDFFLYGNRVLVRQSGAVLTVTIQRKIPQKLWQDVYSSQKGDRYIVAYVWKMLPRVNQEILKQKYASGHVFLKSISTLDIVALLLNYNKKTIQVRWPLAISDFPMPPELKIAGDEIYVRDFIDAMSSYFSSNYDDCIRRLVTATENFFEANKLPGNGFKDTVVKNISGGALAQKSIKSNLLFIYKLRNKIVHNKFRINPARGWICFKAISTVKYLFGSPLNTTNHMAAGYVSRIEMQFNMLRDFAGGFTNLDDIERAQSNPKNEPNEDNVIRTQEQMDKFMFSSLEITPKERGLVLMK